MLTLVYPTPNHQTDEAHTFLVGSVQEGQGILVDGEHIPVSPLGYFSWQIALSPGPNTLSVQVYDPNVEKPVEEKTLTITRRPAFAVLPENPLTLQLETVEPQGNWIVMPGSSFSIRFLASPGCQVSLSIPGLLLEPVMLNQFEGSGSIENREAIFASLHQTQPTLPKQGYVDSQILIPFTAKAGENYPIQIHLAHSSGKTKTIELPNTVTVWTQPKSAVVTTDRAVVRVAPEKGSRWTPQRQGTQLCIDGAIGTWYRVRLRTGQAVWIEEQDITLANHPPTSHKSLSIVQVKVLSSSSAQVFLPTSSRGPVQILSSSNGLKVRLYDVIPQIDFIQYPPENTIIKELSWRPVSDGIVEFNLLVDDLGGYEYFYTETGWVLQVRQAYVPVTKTIILIDPGHGGEEPGAHSPTGVPEKQLNLSISISMAKYLRQAGFQVFLTRDQDQTVSLAERAAQVTKHQAHLVISLHHNALPDGRDPLTEKGLSTYYYQGHSAHFTHQLQQQLCGTLDVPNYGVLYDSLHMTRIHQAIALLLEVGFLTHPEECERLLDPTFQERFAKQAAQVITNLWQTSGGHRR